MSNRSKWRLTQQGLTELESRLSVKDQTLESKAHQMDIDVKTARKILNRKGNDRAILASVLRRFDIPQPDTYLEAIPVEVAEAEPCAILPAPLPSPPARVRISPPYRVLAASFAVVAAALLALAFRQPPRPEWLETYKEARTAYHSGRYGDAREALASLTRTSVLNKTPSARAEAMRLEGDLLAKEGNLPAAIDRYRRAIVLHDEFQQDWGRASVLEALGVAEARLGRFEISEQSLRESIEGLRRCGDDRGTASAMRSLGWVHARKGDRDEARRWFASALVAMKRDPDPLLFTDIKAQRAMLLSAEGQPDRALRDLRECLARWKERNHSRWIATTMRQIAMVYWDKSEPAQAFRAMNQARQLYATVGDHLSAQECAAWLSGKALRST